MGKYRAGRRSGKLAREQLDWPVSFFGPISAARALELAHDILVDRADDPGYCAKFIELIAGLAVDPDTTEGARVQKTNAAFAVVYLGYGVYQATAVEDFVSRLQTRHKLK